MAGLTPERLSEVKDRLLDRKKRLWLEVKDQLKSSIGDGYQEMLSTAREEKIMKMRFGIGDEVEHTLEEIGRAFKVSRERIRQIEKKALKRLKHPTRKAALEDFLE